MNGVFFRRRFEARSRALPGAPGRDPWRRWVTAATLAAAIVAIFGGRARAQDRPTLSGSWSASALSESWTVSEWGPACGPKPAPKGAGGGSVQIREQGGELSIVGAGRAFSTAECWEQMPGMSRTSHSQSGGGRFWRTRCGTAANDPRRATVNTTISATDSSISLNETGEYQFIIEATTCRASVVRSRSFSLVRREGEAPPAASASAVAPPPSAAAAPPPAPRPAPEPRPASRCTGAAGEPARLEVHPGRKLLRAGERFTFRAIVLDADGCPTGTRPAWSIAPGPLAAKATVDGGGTLAVAADSAEGKLELGAAVAGKGVTVVVEVASPEHYDALLAASGLDDAGEASEAAVAVIATGTIGGRTGVAEDGARGRKMLFVAIVASLAAALGFVGLVLSRRGRGRAVDDAPPDSQGAEAPPEPVAAGEPPARPGPAPGARAASKAASRGKICPNCGERYGAEATFCGKDATVLVPLN